MGFGRWLIEMVLNKSPLAQAEASTSADAKVLPVLLSGWGLIGAANVSLPRYKHPPLPGRVPRVGPGRRWGIAKG